MLRRLAIGFVVLFVVLSFVTGVRFSTWRAEKLDLLQKRSQVIDTKVGKIEYRLEGDRGPILLFVHGTPGGYDQAPDDYPAFRTLAPSRPGYLSTPIEVGRNPAEQAEAHLALLDALGVERVIVMGVSGGGPSAIAFAAAHPKRVRAFVALEAVSQSMELVEAPGFLNSDFLFWLVLDLFDLGPGFESLVKIIVPDPENQDLILDDPAKLDKIKAVLWSGWPPSLRREGFDNDNLQFANLDLPIASILVPTLIIHGTADINVPFSHAELLAAKIPGARLHAIAGADHMMPFTHDQEVRSVLLDFTMQLGE